MQRFRWVFCQLKTLAKCLRVKELRQSLKSLPQDLDETYARILLRIYGSYRQFAFTALQWLVFSERPLRIEELAEAVVIDTESETLFDPEDRFPDPYDILTILSGLITTSKNECGNSTGVTVKLAHFSVKEYLVSQRIQAGPGSEYSIREVEAHIAIANGCLLYLSQFNTIDELISLSTLRGFSLLEYAVKHWYKHARVIEESYKKSLPLADELFWSQKDVFKIWVSLYDLVRFDYGYGSGFEASWEYFQREYIARIRNEDSQALHSASAAGLPMSVQFLLEKGVDIDTQHSFGGSALQVATYTGRETIVRMLLDRGANVNAQGGHYGNALQAASDRGYETVVRMLLDRGANVNAQGGVYENALQTACYLNNETVVQLLIDHEVEVNAQG